ncbi:hypothetical protein CJA_3050 [Cellvibrio japonicus Ueda107]|uniref:Contractile injection system tube protein N-terminal domain-containing protein n=2 Tax=Cellvibrio japonicus TaxID=155077 RepID=B3PD92_CELJU|nr:hypothetical protein CJA_3050 [Cellvibrio japonicus Ueda107]
MFNPASLKVTLANSISENQRNSNSRAAQYVDKSSSSLTVELIFDTSMGPESDKKKLEDVRQYTGKIANEFMKCDKVGDKNAKPKRCMFIWGSFKFVGIMESFDETLDFFSREGMPLRATVSIKMSESRFQFESDAAKKAKQNTPRLGRGSDAPHQAASDAGHDPKDWRDTSLYNGVESPRMPGGDGLAVPGMSASASLGANLGGSVGGSVGIGASMGASAGLGMGGGLGIGANAGSGLSLGGSFSAAASISGNIGGGIGAGANVGGLSLSAASASVNLSPPAFRFGASSSLGTSIPGAFSVNTRECSGLTAGSLLLLAGEVPGRSGKKQGQVAGASVRLGFGGGSLKAKASLGFD